MLVLLVLLLVSVLLPSKDQEACDATETAGHDTRGYPTLTSRLSDMPGWLCGAL